MSDLTSAVVVPFAGRFEYLDAAILSIYQQTLVPTEILIVNDRLNADGFRALIEHVEKFRHFVPNVKCIQSNRAPGAAGTRNSGLENTKSRFVAFLDDDDLFLPWKLELQIQQMVKSGAVISHTNYLRFNSVSMSTALIDTSRHQGTVNAVRKIIFRECWIATPTVCLDLSKFEQDLQIFPEDMRLGEDTIAWARLLLRTGGRLCHVDVESSVVRIQANSIQRRLSTAESQHLREMAQTSLESLAENHGIHRPKLNSLRRSLSGMTTHIYNALGKPAALKKIHKKIVIWL